MPRNGIKAVLARLAEAAGHIRRRHEGRLLILTFHRVRPDGEAAAERPMPNLEVAQSDFRELLRWMKARYEAVSLADWLERGAPPERASFAVTFDDGWADNFEQALPVLEELEIPAAVFLSTGAIEEREPFWWQGGDYPDAEIERLKAAPPVPGWNGAKREALAREFLTWEQAARLGESGLVCFGPHGHRHTLLDTVGRDEALADIRASWQLIRERVPKHALPLLAWPNGNGRDDLTGELAALGLRGALTTQRGTARTPADEPWRLPRNNADRQLAATPALWPWLLLRA